MLCGWGKAKFRELTAEKPINDDQEILFEAQGDTVGLLDGKHGTVEGFLTNAKSTKPNNVKLCYHKVSKTPDDKWKVEKDRVVFCVHV